VSDIVLESILYFLLGFLATALLALMVSPMIWQRAVSLTRRRIERSVPLTLNEIQADKDQMRAEFAMSTRRLEISVDDLRDKAATQIIEINRKRDNIAQLAEEHGEKLQVIEELQTKSSELRVQLQQREEQLEKVNHRLNETHKNVDEQALKFEKIRQRLQNAQTESDGHKIELVAKQTELENMSDKLEVFDSARDQSSSADDPNEEKIAMSKMNALLNTEVTENKEMKQKLEYATHQLTQSNERLERNERELLRLRKSMDDDGSESSDLTSQLVEQQSLNVELSAKLARANLQMEALLHDASNDNVEKAMSSLETEKTSLASKLEGVSKERDSLVEKLTDVTNTNDAEWENERRENSILRERINDLAAQVTAMTASLEGDESPINEILSRQENTQLPQGSKSPGKDRPITLADRIRALQDVAG
jgi:chromosome segregation ATPase